MSEKRKLFGTDGIRGKANEYPMTAELAMKLGQAMTIALKKTSPKPRIIIGKDTRRSGYMLENALTAGITSMGGKAYLLGPLPTPAVAYHIRGMRAHGGIMISASHNPYEDNGLKVFGEDGYKLDDRSESEIENLMLSETDLESHRASSEKIGRAERIDDAMGRYLVNLKSIFPRDFDLDGMKIVFDAANGAAYECGKRLFLELGAEVICRACEPNGTNINKSCSQEDPAILGRWVVENKAEIGIGVDGDADRLVLVDEKGEFIPGEFVMFEMARYLKSEGRLQSDTLVTTDMANAALDAACEKSKIQVARSQVGDRYVTEMLKSKSAIFGGETSGHYIFLDQNTTADGLFSALEVLSLLKKEGRKASSFKNSFGLFPQKLVSIPVKERRPVEQMKDLSSAVVELQKQYEGSGRINIRYSGTQMMMRLMIEGPSVDQIEKDLNQLQEIVRREIGA